MANMKFSTKQLMINKANAQMIVMIAVSSVIIVFSLVATKALLSQRGYQSRVITQKEKALKQLKSNVTSVKMLSTSYTTFENSNYNVLGGLATGAGDLDGDNAKIILDALPSKYDFPALATSLEKLLTSPSYTIDSIVGIDDEVNQQSNLATSTPKPVDMPFEIDVTGDYKAIQNLIVTLDKSIRPFQIQSINFSGKDAELKAEIIAKTFYQPEKSLTIKTQVIK
jgi:Tfp pilus assembly protein PilO